MEALECRSDGPWWRLMSVRVTDEQMAEMGRYFGVIADGILGEIRRVAEGHDAILREIREFRDETAAAHQDLKASIMFVSGDLDRRVRILEGEA